jgi:hypothetical protein
MIGRYAPTRRARRLTVACKACGKAYDPGLSTSKYKYVFCSLDCEYPDFLERMMQFPGMTLEIAKAVADKEPRFAKFSGRFGAC